MKSSITKSADIMSGEPVIKGTRIPISRIKFLLQQDHSIDDIHLQYPHVEKKILQEVIEEVFNNFARF